GFRPPRHPVCVHASILTRPSVRTDESRRVYPPRPKPTRTDLLAAVGKTLADVTAPGLDVLFCGINPGLYSAATGWHFARPGNRFWPTLFASGFTPRPFHPSAERDLLPLGLGI